MGTEVVVRRRDKRDRMKEIRNLVALGYSGTWGDLRWLLDRVEELEKQVAELMRQAAASPLKKDWRRAIGAFQDDPIFDEVVRLGREYREQQTYAKEIAGS